MTVLVRPEQLELQPLEWPEAVAVARRHRPVLGGLAGRVVACEYYGHDAVVRVRPDGDAVPEVIVRTAGGPQLPAGALVVVRARGPVIAWSR